MRILTASLLLLCGTALAALERGTPSVINLRNGKVIGEVYLLSWTCEKATFLLEQGKQARGEQSTDTIRDIELKPNDRNVPAGIYQMKAGKYVDAIGSFNVGIETAMADATKLLAMLNRARCYAALTKYDEAIAGVDLLIKTFPDWVYVVEAQYLKGTWHQQAGRQDQAMATFAALDKNAANYGGVYGQKAKAKAAVGLAGIYRDRKETTKAAELTVGALKTIDPRESPEEWAKLNWDLVGDYRTTAPDQARAIYLRLRFAPVEETYRANAFLELARILRTEDRVAAFDHACMASVFAGDGEIAAAAKALAAEIVEKELRADASLAKETKEEYINYLKKL
jgi:tetratricopeptide (TPR) repeat protein